MAFITEVSYVGLLIRRPESGRGPSNTGSLVPNLASLVAYATRDARFGTRDPVLDGPRPFGATYLLSTIQNNDK
jgi:hypothetical protein